MWEQDNRPSGPSRRLPLKNGFRHGPRVSSGSSQKGNQRRGQLRAPSARACAYLFQKGCPACRLLHSMRAEEGSNGHKSKRRTEDQQKLSHIAATRHQKPDEDKNPQRGGNELLRRKRRSRALREILRCKTRAPAKERRWRSPQGCRSESEIPWRPVLSRLPPSLPPPRGSSAGKAAATGTAKAATAAASPLGKDRASRPLGRSRPTRLLSGATMRPAMSAAMQAAAATCFLPVDGQDQSKKDEDISLAEKLHGLRRMPEEEGHLVTAGETERRAHV